MDMESIKDFLYKSAGQFMFERPVRTTSYVKLIRSLEKGREVVDERIALAEESAENREQLAHIVGIERWAQSRLRGFLGGRYEMDDYDQYAPSTSLSVAEMRNEFNEAREATVETVRRLDLSGVMSYEKVPHNQFGELTSRGWIQYILGHSNIESRRLKKAKAEPAPTTAA